MANASASTTVGTDVVELFHAENQQDSVAVLGTDTAKATAISIINKGAVEALIQCLDVHGASEWGPLPAGASITLRAVQRPQNSENTIGIVNAKTASGTTTLGYLVTEWI